MRLRDHADGVHRLYSLDQRCRRMHHRGARRHTCMQTMRHLLHVTTLSEPCRIQARLVGGEERLGHAPQHC